MLTEIKNRGTKDVCILVCDGLTGLPDAVASVWPQTIVQACVVHLIRDSFRYASRRDWPAAGQGPQAHLHRPDRGGRLGPLGRVLRALGGQVPGHREAVGERLGRVRAVPELRPPRSGR